MISVVVPARNAEATLDGCLAALAAQTMPREQYELIVVDDGSTDRTAEIAARHGARLFRQAPAGPAAARNRGIEAAQGELVLFTDADCEPSTEWVAGMTAPFVDPAVMGVKGAYRTRQRAWIARLVQLEFEIRYERMAALPHIDFIDTYAAAYRRQLLLDSGGFDTAFSAPSAEDIDLSFRLAQQGHKLVFAPRAWVWHRHPASLWAYLRRKARYGYWRALLYRRYPSKIGGDAHTDPALKLQFALVALLALAGIAGLVWPFALPLAAILGVGFLITTWSFVRWAWPRDRTVAICWPAVHFLRVLVQGIGLIAGLLAHPVFRRDGHA